jgi:DNA-binding transcriptional LysR family regulator
MLGSVQETDIRLLRVFQAVARCGGFTAAQAELNMTQSTISGHMAELESRLGMRLCQRGQSGFRLTQDGEVVVEAAEKLFAALEDFRTYVNERTETLRGELRLGMIDNMVTNPESRISVAIARLNEHAPAVQLSIFVGGTTELERRVIDGRLHLAVGLFHHRIPSIKYETLFTEAHALYCAREHPLFDVEQEDALLKGVQEASYVSWDYMETFDQLRPRIPLREVAATPYIDGLALMVLSGRYIAYLPKHYVAQWERSGQVKPLLPHLTERTIDVHLASRQGEKQPRLVSHFSELLKATHMHDVECGRLIG